MSAKILLIEDDPIWEDVICEFLRDDGYRVEVANTAQEARKKLGLSDEQAFPPQFDLLIVDIRLPAALDGLEILVELRTRCTEAGISLRQQPRLIISSVLSTASVSNWEKKIQWDSYFEKPYKLETFMKFVRFTFPLDEGIDVGNNEEGA